MNDLLRQNKLEQEMSEMASNQAAMANQKEKKQQAHAEMKQFWQDQLQENRDQRQRQKDADDVYKKQIEV